MHAILEAADPAKAIGKALRFSQGNMLVKDRMVLENLGKFNQTFLFGAGKASCEMASACLQAGLKVNGGIIITKTAHGTQRDKEICAQHAVEVYEASHPVPCENGARATNNIVRLLKEIDSPSTLVIWLASGGGSALTGGVGVHPHLDLAALKESIQWLLDSGAEITQGKAKSIIRNAPLTTTTFFGC